MHVHRGVFTGDKKKYFVDAYIKNFGMINVLSNITAYKLLCIVVFLYILDLQTFTLRLYIKIVVLCVKCENVDECLLGNLIRKIQCMRLIHRPLHRSTDNFRISFSQFSRKLQQLRLIVQRCKIRTNHKNLFSICNRWYMAHSFEQFCVTLSHIVVANINRGLLS